MRAQEGLRILFPIDTLSNERQQKIYTNLLSFSTLTKATSKKQALFLAVHFQPRPHRQAS
jgi:hypothetical protein